jgi:AhpD family alkylhydroperoxidase
VRPTPGFSERDHARRTYTSAGQLWQEVSRLLLRRSGWRGLRRALRLPATFRERLMLAVTAVNRCRYCARLHGSLAERAGVAADEITALLAGEVETAPPGERLALEYASEGAAADGRPGPAARAELSHCYGERGAEAIDATLLAIRIGNLLGNGLDHWLGRALPRRTSPDRFRSAAGPGGSAG